MKLPRAIAFGFVALCLRTGGDAPGGVGPGTELSAIDEHGERLRFRIEAVERDPKDAQGEVSLYTLSVRPPHSDRFVPYCARDAEGRAAAIAVRGSWDARGDFHDEPNLVTFACTNGAIAKCVRFGYKPWKDVAGTSLRPLHLACVRMVRADYCGDGVAHTREGTRVDLWDDVGIHPPSELDPAAEVFEAAWSAAGAEYLAVPRWSDDVQEIVRTCPTRLRERTSRELQLTASEARTRFPDAVLFNARFVRPEERTAAQPVFGALPGPTGSAWGSAP